MITYLFFRKAHEKTRKIFFIIFLVSIAFFVVLLFVYPQNLTSDFSNTLKEFIKQTENAKEQDVINEKSSLPMNVANARNQFEQAWVNTPLDVKFKTSDSLIYLGLKNNLRIYRKQEFDSRTKVNSKKWADIGIDYFEQSNSKRYLCEMLLEKSALLLEFSQLEHTDIEDFRAIVREGDELMARTFQLVSRDSRSEILRHWSRFYYDLARPKSNRLS